MPKAAYTPAPVALALLGVALLMRGCQSRILGTDITVLEHSVSILNHQLTVGARIQRLDHHFTTRADPTTCAATVDTVFVLVVPTSRSLGGAP